MPEINVKVYRLLSDTKKEVPLDFKVAESIFSKALAFLKKTDPTYPRLKKYIDIACSNRGIRLDYWDIQRNCKKEDLKYFSDLQARANHTAGLSYWELSLTISEPKFGWLHQVVIQVPQDNEIINFIKKKGLEQDIFYSRNNDPQTIGWAAGDIRQALGGYNGRRLGVLLAGSPGWDKRIRLRTRSCRSKNEGLLPATLNDCNNMFKLIHGLSPTNLLYGAVLAGLIKSKKAFIDLLICLRTYNSKVAEKYVLNQNHVEGVLYINSEVPGHAIKGGILYDYRTSKAKDGQNTFSGMIKGAIFGPLFDIECERLIGPVHGWVPVDKEFTKSNKSTFDMPYLVDLPIPYVPNVFNTDYAVIYYSGHGNPKGIQIEKNETITPQELAQVCMEYKISLFLILDMCYAANFAKEFTQQMKNNGMPSVVMCSEDISMKSYESKECVDLWSFHWPIDIQRSDITCGQGVYSTAISFGLICIREMEMKQAGYPSISEIGAFSMVQGRTSIISIQDFNDKILKSICETMATAYGVPLQKPSVYWC